MKRYYGGPRWPDENGEWVLYSDAVAEIEKERRELGTAWHKSAVEMEKLARSDERERIVRELRKEGSSIRSDEHTFYLSAADFVEDNGRPQEPKPYDDHWKPIEKLNPDTKVTGRVVDLEVVNLVNALVDAVNDLRSRLLSRGER